jgi:3-isopropylmalate/(R)-2-methylmalate dehydratase small subunit
MDKFTTLTGVAAPMPMINIDTDMIIPKQFLKTIQRSGLGKSLFFEMRYGDDGSEIPDFVLNQPAYRHAQIIVAGDNFGCGSSREHAPWALLDFGIRAVIAPSFADIFNGNCFKNGMLPIKLPQEQVDVLLADAAGGNTRTLTIDLPSQRVIRANGESFSFDIDPSTKHALIEGLDEIGQTLKRAPEIAAWEQKQHLSQPWLWSSEAA